MLTFIVQFHERVACILSLMSFLDLSMYQLSSMTSERDSLRQEKEKLSVSLSELQTLLKSKEQELQQARTQAETEKVCIWTGAL